MSEETKLRGNCHHCGGKLKFAAHMAGTGVTCPHCRQFTVLQTAVAASAAPDVSSAMATTQPISTPAPEALLPQQKPVCPRCQEPIEPVDRLCVQCGFDIPQPINWVRWGALALIAVQLGYLLLRWTGLDQRVQDAFKAKLGFAKADVYAGPVMAQKGFTDEGGKKGDGPDDAPPPPLETGAPRLVFAKHPELKEEGTFYFITGTVQNNSATDTYFKVEVKFQLQDAQGNPLGMVQDYVAFLDPGKTWDFRVLVVDPDATQYVLQGNIGGTR
jgi:hypothetical protein